MTHLRRRGSFFGIVATITLVAGISVVDSRNELFRELGWFDPPDRLPDYPRIVLWAWERPEDLSFIDTEEIGVAFLAKTIVMEGDAVSIRPRLQPLNVPDGTALMAVARIESKRPALTDLQRTDVVSAVEKMAELPEVRAIQVDFDAVESERVFYEALLRDLRGRLPKAIRLSITALASWCIGDTWIKNLPVDELFRCFSGWVERTLQFVTTSKPAMTFDSTCAARATVFRRMNLGRYCLQDGAFMFSTSGPGLTRKPASQSDA